MISVASIDLLQLVGVDLKRKAGTRGGEYAGPCPACGGRDRLTVQPQGGEDRRGLWMCRQCHPDWTDAIGWVMWREGLDFRAACDRLDVALESRPHIPLPPPPPALEAPPADRWQEAAARWIVRCQEALYDGTNPRAHAYLESRGFTAATINEAQLGYNPVDLWIERSLWGLDGDGRIWLPRGIVIPWLHAGQIWKVSVRRPADKDGRGPYITISGSANVPYGLDDVQPGQPAVIVEGPFDALAIWQATRTAALAVGTTQARRIQWITRIARARPILIALDNEANKNVQAAVAYWLDALAPLAIHYPPIGKDSAKDLEDGRDLAAWLAGGLEAAATPAAVGAAA